jgi:hypothetical protein
VATELRAHTKQCALCRHELNWLESESTLFRQRAGRDEVAHLWTGVAERRGLEPRPWSRVLVAMAASAALVLGIGQLAPRAQPKLEQEPLESDALMSPALFLDTQAPCSQLPSGMGFTCTGPIVASR